MILLNIFILYAHIMVFNYGYQEPSEKTSRRMGSMTCKASVSGKSPQVTASPVADVYSLVTSASAAATSRGESDKSIKEEN